MANNENVNKVVFGEDTIMDITDTTAEAADVASGKVFYAKSGARTLGTASGGGGKGVYYGTCNNADNVAAKTVACAGFELEAGAAIAVYFPNGNTSTGTTLNVGGTGAKPIAFSVASRPVSSDLPFRFSFGTILFVYNGNSYVPQGYCDNPSMVVNATSTTDAGTAEKTASNLHGNITSDSSLYLVKFSNANTVQGALTLSIDNETARPIHYGGAATSASNPLLWEEGDVLLFARDIVSRAYTCIGGGIATDTVAGLIKTNSAQSITLNAAGQLEVGGRLGQFPDTTGIYASADRDPRHVGDSSFLITDAMGMSLDTSRAFALVSGYGVTCRSAAAGSTQYRVANNYANRLKCKMAEGGFASINEATSKVQRIVPVVSVTIGGNPYTPDSSANPSGTANDIIITTAETLNPSGSMSNIRLFGVMKSYSSAHVGNGIASLGGGRNLLIGGGITKAGSSNDDCVVGNDIYVSGNGNAAFGRLHIMPKNRGFAAGSGHDFTSAPAEGAAAVGQYSSVTSTTLFAVGNGTSQTARSNAFEVTSDGGIVLKSPNGTRYKITVSNTGSITATAI